MTSKFTLIVFVQALLIAVWAAGFFWSFPRENMLVTNATFGILWIAQIFILVFYVIRIQKQFKAFIQSIRFSDDSVVLAKQKNTFQPIYQEFERVFNDFYQLKTEKEAESLYHQYMLEYVATGLICFDENGAIKTVNKAAMYLLQTSEPKKLNDLVKVEASFPETLRKLPAGHTELFNIEQPGNKLALALKASEMTLQGEKLKLIAFQNIQSELDENRFESWEKLSRVLRHEILNSISPVAILSSSLLKIFEKEGTLRPKEEIDEDMMEDTLAGLRAIQKRSKGLRKFIENYTGLFKVPEPTVAVFKVEDLFKRILDLYKKDETNSQVNFVVEISKGSQYLTADEKLVEQVLINLVKNALGAIKSSEEPQLTLKALPKGEKTILEVVDNGSGMSEEVVKNLFIPFFTTKEEGSGIGLSLSWQIMHRHGGDISVQSEEGKGTTFSLIFPVRNQ